MEEKIEALKQNMSWSIIQLPTCKKMVGCRWTYKIKYYNEEKIDIYKAIVKRYTQVQGVNFQETLAPVAKMISIRFC